MICLSQEKYIEKVLSEFGMLDSNPVATPMEAGLKLTPKTEKQAPEAWIHLYQSAVSSLMYAMIKTRPDIAFVVSTLSIYASNPSNEHWAALKRVFRYLNGTRDLSIVYSKGSLLGYTDSDWAGDITTRKSTSGYVFLLRSGTIS